MPMKSLHEFLHIYEVSFVKKPVESKRFRKFPPDKLHFPVETGAYVYGNLLSPTALVVGYPDQDLCSSLVGSDCGICIAGHCLTANIGVEKIVVNIVSNPNIRFLILAGRESRGHLSLDAIYKLWKNGINENRRIIGARGLTPYVKNIPVSVVERFKRQILHAIYLVGESDEETIKQVARCCIQEPQNAMEVQVKTKNGNEIGKYLLYDPGAYPEEPLVFSITKRLEGEGIVEIASGQSVNIIAPTIATAYPLAVDAVLSVGKNVRDERGAVTKEVLGFSVAILDPLTERIPDGYRPNPALTSDEETKEFLDNYAKTLLYSDAAVNVNPKGKVVMTKSKLDYVYGQRLTKSSWFSEAKDLTPWLPIDQLSKVIGALSVAIKNDVQTRRVGMTLLNPATDMSEDTRKKEGEIPCLTNIFLYPRKEDGQWKIEGYFVMRSWDVHGALPANLYAFSEFLKHIVLRVSEEIGLEVKVGGIHVTAGSAHIYV